MLRTCLYGTIKYHIAVSILSFGKHEQLMNTVRSFHENAFMYSKFWYCISSTEIAIAFTLSWRQHQSIHTKIFSEVDENTESFSKI